MFDLNISMIEDILSRAKFWWVWTIEDGETFDLCVHYGTKMWTTKINKTTYGILRDLDMPNKRKENAN